METRKDIKFRLMILQVIMELKWGFNQVKEKENKFL
jgi:hypothetical protein